MKIRNGQISEIENFPLYNEDNEGDELIVVEHEGKVVAYAQFTGARVYFMESELRGAGRMMIEFLKGEFDHIVAVNVVATAEGFYSKMGFERCGSDGYGGFNMDWWLD